MFCTNCGKKLEDGDRFCGNCGAPVDVPTVTLEQTQQPIQQETVGAENSAIPVAAMAAAPVTEEIPVAEIPAEEIVEPVETSPQAAINFESIPQEMKTQATKASQPAPEKKKTKKILLIVGIIVGALIITLAAIFIVRAAFNKALNRITPNTMTDEEYIDIVKTGYLPDYKQYTVGDVFDNVFISSEWKYFQASDGDHVVQYETLAFPHGQPANVLLQFIVQDDDFYLYALEYDGEVQDDAEIKEFLGQVYDEAKYCLNTDPEPATTSSVGGKEEALESAKDYIKYLSFSYTELVEQLEWEGFSSEDAIYAADNCGADWYKEAEDAAMEYLDYSGFSYTGLIDMLKFLGFTEDQATKAVDKCGADWNEQAAKCAESYMEYGDFSKDELADQLEYEGFTPEQVAYGLAAVGY